MTNASCDPEGEKTTCSTPSPKLLNALLGQGGVIFFPARHRSLLAQYTLFQVTRSATNGRILAAIKSRGILGLDEDDAWARDEVAGADGRGLSCCGAVACRLLAVDDDSPSLALLLIVIMHSRSNYLGVVKLVLHPIVMAAIIA